MFIDVPTSARVADLRREIEGIKELNSCFWSKHHHSRQDLAARERRKIRLEEIKQQLAALRPAA